MPDHYTIYQTRATDYDRLVRCEDYQGNLLPALQAIQPLSDCVVAEFGAGTGRLTRLLAPVVKSIVACDMSAHMLGVAATSLAGCDTCHLVVADNRQMPLQTGFADIAIAGWSLGTGVGWFGKRWPEEVGRAVANMRRVLRPGGTAIIIETMGTGRETPAPPHEGLAAYYRWLEVEHGFSATTLRTDYQFATVAEARELIGFFFGDELAATVTDRPVVPECTGIWWL